jgi:hypothetical protein
MRPLGILVLAMAAFAAPAHASDGGVIIGEVSSQVARSGVDYEMLLRSASEQEILSLDLSKVPHGRQVIVSVALVRLETLAERRTTDTTCKISATVRDAKRGSIFAILEGEAHASSRDSASDVESTAVRGALHGALGHIPELLRR